MTDFAELRKLIREEERARWAVEKQMSKATKRTTSFSSSGRGGGKPGSQVEENSILLAALEDDHKEIAAALEAARKELRAGIALLPMKEYRLERSMIRMRYIRGIEVRKIAEARNYSEQHVFRVVKRAEILINQAQRAAEEGAKEESSC